MADLVDLNTNVINTIWRPIYGKLIVGFKNMTPEWAALKRMKNFISLSPRGSGGEGGYGPSAAINWPVILRNGGGIAFTKDGGSLARASSNEPPQANATWAYLTGRFELSFTPLVGGRGMEKQAIVRQVGYQAADKLRAFKRQIAMSFYGKPDNILFLAQAASTANAGDTNHTDVPIKALYGVDTAISANTFVEDYIAPGMDRVTVKDGLGAGSSPNHDDATTRVLVGSVKERSGSSVPVLTLETGSANTAIAAGDAIVLANAVMDDGADNLGIGINGLLHLCRDTTVHGISKDTYQEWYPTVDVTNYANTISGKDLYRWKKKIRNRSGMEVSWMYTTVDVCANAGGPQLELRRYDDKNDTMRLGFDSLSLGGVMVEGYPYCPPGHLFMGAKNAVQKIAPDEDLRMVVTQGERDGGFQQYPNQLAFYKDQLIRTQMAAKCRRALGIVSGISEA